MVENRDLEESGNFLGDPLIFLIGLIFAAPAVENSIVLSQRTFCRQSSDEGRPVISHPHVRRRNAQQ